MIEIKPLTEVSADLLNGIITGYVSDAKFRVTRTESEAQTTFALELVRLEKPYVKQYEAMDEATLERYKGIVRQGFSLGAYEGDKLIALALAEMHDWNMTLWVWEFHVAEKWRGRGIGQMLMEALAEKGRAARLRAIFCETQTTNVPAIRFYRRAGFALDGINLSLYSNDDWPDGEIAIFMKRKLS